MQDVTSANDDSEVAQAHRNIIEASNTTFVFHDGQQEELLVTFYLFLPQLAR